MDKRTTIAKAAPAKTIVMKTPPRMTAVMDRVSAQAGALISPKLGITRMPTGPGEEEGPSDQTSLFVRRFPTKEVKMESRAKPSATTIQPRKASSNLATRMVYADEHSPPIQPANFRAEIPLSGNSRPPLPPRRGRSKNKWRAGSEGVRRIERLLKPAILVAVVAVSAVVVLAQRSENVAAAAGADNNSLSRETSDPPDNGAVPSHPEANRTPRNTPMKGTSEGGGVRAGARSSASPSVGTSQSTSESNAASLLISGHREEALKHYRKLAALPNAAAGVRAMFIVLEQKVKSP